MNLNVTNLSDEQLFMVITEAAKKHMLGKLFTSKMSDLPQKHIVIDDDIKQNGISLDEILQDNELFCTTLNFDDDDFVKDRIETSKSPLNIHLIDKQSKTVLKIEASSDIESAKINNHEQDEYYNDDTLKYALMDVFNIVAMCDCIVSPVEKEIIE